MWTGVKGAKFAHTTASARGFGGMGAGCMQLVGMMLRLSACCLLVCAWWCVTHKPAAP